MPSVKAARAAFTDGMHVAALISALVLVVVAVAVLRALRHLPPIGAATTEPCSPELAPPSTETASVEPEPALAEHALAE
jgi:DHA2 family multidrug resistance protein-like MFS transporter